MNESFHLYDKGFGPASITIEMVSHCEFCTMVQCDTQSKTPVHCTKLSGFGSPILVNLTACLTCGEYKNPIGASQIKPITS